MRAWPVALIAAGVAAGGGAAMMVAFDPPERSNARAATAPPADAQPQNLDDYNAPYDGKYHFVRVRYDPRGRGGGGFGRGRGREPMWAHDYPRAERNFLKILDETTFVGPLLEGSNILRFDDPEIHRALFGDIIKIRPDDLDPAVDDIVHVCHIQVFEGA